MKTASKSIVGLTRAGALRRRVGASIAMMAMLAGTIVVLAPASIAVAQDLTPRAPVQKSPIALVGVDVYPVDAEPIIDGYVLFDQGKLRAIGKRADFKPGAGVQVRDFATGVDAKTPPGAAPASPGAVRARVYPGLISAYTRMGLEEIGAVRPSTDMNEAGDITPEVVAASTVNPDSWLMPVARSNGVLIFGAFPTGGTIAGRASVISADGWTTEDLTVRRDAGLVVQWPRVRTVRAWWMDQSEEDQQRRTKESLDRLTGPTGAFARAKAYIAAKDADATGVPTDLRWEAMRSIFPSPASAPGGPGAGAARSEAQRTVFVEAQEYDQILSAVAFARRENLKLTIVGGRDAVLASEQLKAINASVIVNAVINLPRREDTPYDDMFTLPKRLKDAGIAFAIASGEETPHERNLPYAAGMAAAHGLDSASALRSVTLSAAEILGVADVIGSITPGKDATIIITRGDPLDVRTDVVGAYIQGRPIDLSNKQTILAERYREKYRQGK
ncbi:MAG: amidohydrolase family protein [Phycisphaerales bacterium]|nr:amidohydrolase family protein [Phycisphaerales bacterium]